MNFGQVGRELLQELKRSEWLPLYSEDAVSRCILVRGLPLSCGVVGRLPCRLLAYAHASVADAWHALIQPLQQPHTQECKGHWAEIRQTLEQGEVVSVDGCW